MGRLRASTCGQQVPMRRGGHRANVVRMHRRTVPITVAEAKELHSKTASVCRQEVIDSRADLTMLRRLPALAEVGNVATTPQTTRVRSPPTRTCGEIADEAATPSPWRGRGSR